MITVGCVPALSTAESPTEPIDALRAEFGGCRVLVVEDSDIFATVLGALLEEAGLVVDQAEHGEQALMRIADEAYAAVLMDVEMPVMDGLEATRRLRALPGNRRVPVVAMTASNREQDRKRCHDAGMNAFITKPAEPDELYAVLLRLLRGAR